VHFLLIVGREKALKRSVYPETRPRNKDYKK